MKTILMAMALAAGLASPVMAQDAPRLCGGSDYNLPVPDDEPADHRQFTVQPLVYVEGHKTPGVYGIDIDLVVDESGQVVCASPKTLDGTDTAQRRTLYRQVAGWRYTPFLIDGRAARVMVMERTEEEVRPARHVAMPTAALSRISVRLSFPGNTAVIRGDGTAEFAAIDITTGKTIRNRYAIDPGEFAAFVERLRGADAWSLAPNYVRSLPDDMGMNEIRIDIGGQVKTIVWRHADLAGMPGAMITAIEEGRRVARFDDWQRSIIPMPSIPVPPQIEPTVPVRQSDPPIPAPQPSPAPARTPGR
ncbi:hypothetical protein [Asticcacaulis solisilvae]|uniref:hypothetical protein n=1 Tax=Asticcacaulis solisilvae TaxID=1217274 RepID=UPI003FD77EE1